MSNEPNNIKPRFLIGIGFIVFALMMLFDNLGLHVVGKVVSNWPLGLIIIGVAFLYGPFKIKKQEGSNSNMPYYFIGFGVLFFLAQNNFFNFSFGRLIGPAILLAIGVHILRPRARKHHRKKHSDEGLDDVDMEVSEGVDEGLLIEGEVNSSIDAGFTTSEDEKNIDVFNVLGGSEFSTYSKRLAGGNVICIMGGAEIDIREADTENDTIEIEVLAFMGGVEIKVPPHWQVSVKAIPFLGGVSNKTTCIAHKLQMSKKHLVVSGLAFMGGIDIRN